MRSTLFFILCVSVLTFAQQPCSKEPAQAEQGKAVTPGQKIFEENCMRCHAADGSSNTFIGHKWKIPDLRSDAVQKLSPEQRIEIITEGKDRMPAHKNKLTADEIRQVESYVRELGKKPSTPAQ
ncbi:MAG TPA: c-type cytochrome [Terriglobales bacterium]|jgi:cytochrome c6|nr:c-type cytochrome [Terriglobales bacterium]